MAASKTTETSGSGARAKLAEIREIEKTSGPAAAERALVDFIRDGSQSHFAFVALARVLLKQGKLDDAVRAAAKAVSLAPLEAEPMIALGVVNLRMHEQSRAAEAFANAIRLDPNSARAHLGAAAVKMADESYEDALILCDRVLDLDPSMERAHELIARINMKQGRKDLAIAELKSLIERNPANKRVLRAYVRLMRTEGRGDEVIAFLERDAAANPDDKSRVDRLSLVAAKSGRPEVAVEQYRRLIDEGSSKISDKVRYTMALVQAGEMDKARAMIDSLGDQRVLKPVVAKLNGDIALKTGDPALAMKSYQAACRSARVDMLPAEQEQAAAGIEEKAKLWKAHTTQSVILAFRERRSAAD